MYFKLLVIAGLAWAFNCVSGDIVNILIDNSKPVWRELNETASETDYPQSAILEQVGSVLSDDGLNGTLVLEGSTQTSLSDDDLGGRQEFGQNSNSEDLSTSYTPGYCRCINKYYCTGPNSKVLRKKRAVNTPPCRNRDEVMCCLTTGPGCGVPANFPYFNPYPLYGEANFGDYPWTALIMDTNNQIIYGVGIVVSWKVVITTARNVQNIPVGKSIRLKVRVGEWDLSTNDEPFKPQEYPVSEIIVHPRFNPKTYQNDIAILKLANFVDLSSFPSIRSACLSQPTDVFNFNDAKCLVAGWGNQASLKKRITNNPSSGQSLPAASQQQQQPQQRNILKEVDLQMVDGAVCQDALRRNVGDSQFLLDQRSFLCAGGEAGKGLCKGDEGAALVCKDKRSSRFQVVGMASWGTTCGQSGFPVVFTNMASYYDWIKSVDPNIGQV